MVVELGLITTSGVIIVEAMLCALRNDGGRCASNVGVAMVAVFIVESILIVGWSVLRYRLANSPYTEWEAWAQSQP